MRTINNEYHRYKYLISFYFMMKIISFDVGIKNMAYCIFLLKSESESESESQENPFKIMDWNVVSLMEEEKPNIFCNANSTKTVLKKPKKNMNKSLLNESSEQKRCCRIGKYTKGTNIYCDKHSKTQTEWLIPETRFSQKVLKKTKIEDMIQLASELKIENIGKKRVDIMKTFDDFVVNKCLEPVISVKNKSAGEVDLVSIGKKMKDVFDNVLKEHKDISHVLIENQISPLANRMKTIQGMLSQYFIMQYDAISIEFISSFNKLKTFSDIKKDTLELEFDVDAQVARNICQTESNKTQTQKYKNHKKDGVYYSKMVLENNIWISNNQWTIIMDSKKKDDLADCFLQGLWYLIKIKKITMNKNCLITKIK